MGGGGGMCVCLPAENFLVLYSLSIELFYVTPAEIILTLF